MNIKPCSVALLPILFFAAASAAQAQISGFSGFAKTNGTAVSSGASLTLTSNVGSEAGSAFDSTPQNIGSGFDTSFLYTVGGDKSADGITFTFQNDPRGTSALGSGGGYLGYGGVGSITKSVAMELNFNLTNSTGLDTNGGIGTPTTISGGVNLASGQPVSVHLVYDGSSLTETLMQSGNVFTVLYQVGRLQTVVGSPDAYVGFTGSDGGSASTQTISNFSFQNAPVPEASTAVSFGLFLALGLGGLAATARKKPVHHTGS